MNDLRNISSDKIWRQRGEGGRMSDNSWPPGRPVEFPCGPEWVTRRHLSSCIHTYLASEDGSLSTPNLFVRNGFTMHVYQIHLKLVVMDKKYVKIYFGESWGHLYMKTAATWSCVHSFQLFNAMTQQFLILRYCADFLAHFATSVIRKCCKFCLNPSPHLSTTSSEMEVSL